MVPGKSPYLFGYEESNINILTDAEPPYDSETGSVELANIPCRVYKEYFTKTRKLEEHSDRFQ